MKKLEDYGMHAGAKPEIFRFAKQLRANMTDTEKKLWGFLKLKPMGFKFRRQHPFGIYIIDFFCYKTRLAIEIDGKYHELPTQKKLDDIRTKEINQLGITELRFDDEEIMRSFEEVTQSILTFCSSHDIK